MGDAEQQGPAVSAPAPASAQLSPGDAVVVTGAARGIGRAIALDLAGRGMAVSAWDLDAGGAERTARDCAALGVPARGRGVDVSRPEEIEAAARATLADCGPVFGVVNNAGIFPRASILDATPDLWLDVLRTNLLGTVLVTRAFLPAMIAAGRGAVVNLGSGRSVQGAIGGAHYGASKAGIVSFTKSLALEVAPHGLRANCLIPGLTETAQPLAHYSPRELSDLAKRVVPLGRVAQPEDMAGAVHFLLSDAAGFMTGQSIAVNGGMIMLP